MTRTVAFLLVPEVLMLDFAGPVEVFSIANRYLPTADHYRIVTIAAGRRRTLRCSNGMTIRTELTTQQPPGSYDLLLAHQPRSAPKAEAAGADLQLSGHTHGGQFWPWMHFVRLQQPWVSGIHRLGRLTVYISRGTGYWGPPLRFGAPSEITLIRLRKG